MIHKLPPADVQTDLTALRASLESEISRLRTLFRFKAQPNDISDVCNADSVDEAADRLTDLLGSLPVPENEALLKLIATWRETADIWQHELDRGSTYAPLKFKQPPSKSRADIQNWINWLRAMANDADAALLSRSAQEPPKEEYEQEALNALTLRVDVAETELRQTIIDRDQARADYQRLDDAAEYLWAVVANVSEGNWHQQPQTWQDAAARARDGYWSSRVSRSRAPQEGLQAELCEALLKVANAITAQMSGESRRMDKYPLRPALAVVIDMQQAARDGDLIIVTPPEKEPRGR